MGYGSRERRPAGGLIGRASASDETRDSGGGGENSLAEAGTGLNSLELELGGEANDLLVDVDGGGEIMEDLLVEIEPDRELDMDGTDGRG